MVTSRRFQPTDSRNELNAAQNAFKQALRIYPGCQDAIGYLGNVAVARKDYQAAKDYFGRAITLWPDDVRSLHSFAFLLATCPSLPLRDGKLALRHAQHACELTDWKDAYILETLAAAYWQSGDRKRAIEWQKKSLAIAPDYAVATIRKHLEQLQQQNNR